MMPAIVVDAARFVQLFAEFGKLADKKIEAAIVVIVEPDSAGGPSRRSYPRFFGDVGKRAIAIVVIQNAAAVLGDVKVGQAIAIVISRGDPLPEIRRPAPRLFPSHR